MVKSYYKPNPLAAARRAHLESLVASGLAALRAGVGPSPEQAAAIRNAYRTASRQLREGRRADFSVKQQGVLLQIEEARAAYDALQAQQEAKARTWAHQRAAQAVAAGVDPFTGAPAPAEGTQEWVL